MVAFTVEQIHHLMGKATNIRNVSVLAHPDHGATELIDTLAGSKAHIFCRPDSYSCRYGPNSQDTEETPLVTIKPTTTPLYFEMTEERLLNIKQEFKGSEFLINLLWPPKHIDLIGGVTGNLRVTDGALIVTHCLDPIPAATRNVLRRVIDEYVKPLLVLSQIEKVILESQFSQEDLYQGFAWTIQSANNVITTSDINKDIFGNDLLFDPVQGTVAFASGLHGWGFTLHQFADRYARKFGVDRVKMAKRLWGDYYFNTATKVWTRKSIDDDGQPLSRGFNVFVLDPILKLCDAFLNFKTERSEEILQKLQIQLTESEKELSGKALLKVVMKKFLPASDALLEMVVIHLPSPVTAQKYRVDTLYEGPKGDECAVGIRNCDPEGPIMMYVSKMIRTTDKGRFYGFGRVFSGTIRAGQRVRVMGPAFKFGTKGDMYTLPIRRLVLMMSNRAEPIADCPAGNLIGLVGIDQFLLQSGTISSSDCAHNIKVMKFSLTPVVQIVVDTKDPKDLPKLHDGLKRLSRFDPSVTTLTLEAGEHVIAYEREDQLRYLLQDLEVELDEVQIVTAEPFVQYRETVQAESGSALGKSRNKHTRIFMKAMPVMDDLLHALEEGKITAKDDLRARTGVLCDDYGWEPSEARRIWSFGPDGVGPNLLVDSTKGVPYLHEIKESVVTGFQWAMREAVYTEEPMRGGQFHILDVAMIGSAIHRGGGQIIPAARRVIYASSMTAQPGMMEPIYYAEIICPELAMVGVLRTLLKHRGEVLGEEVHPRGRRCYDSLMLMVKVELPVAESFGFQAELSKETENQATVTQMLFNHWKLMPGVSYEDPKLIELILSIRKRKGLKEEIPQLDSYLDRL